MLLTLLAAAPEASVQQAVTRMVNEVARPDEETGTSGTVEASFANATGNTENLTLILGGTLEVDQGATEHRFEAGLRYAEGAPDPTEPRAQTQEAAFASYQLSADLTDRAFAFGRVRYDYDAFSGFEQRVFLGAGLGWHLAETDAVNWTVSGGPGARYTIAAAPDPVPEGFEAEAWAVSAYAASRFAWDVREGLAVTQDAAVTYTEASTTLAGEAALQSALTERLAAKVSYRVQHETDPLEDRAGTDTLLTAGVTFGF